MPKLIDITGHKFGRLTVIGRHDLFNGSARWDCVCECGNQTKVIGSALRSGHSKSCGCLNREISSNHQKKHGQSKCNNWNETGAYNSWCGMFQRCENENNTFYTYYGGRGISICNDWRDFRNFFRDMGPRPTGTTIDRIDGDGNYEPENCRWATRKTQQNNLKNNVLLTHNNKTQTLSGWAEEIGIKRSCLDARIRRGWDVAEALTRKSQKREPGADGAESLANSIWYDCEGRN